MGPLILDTLALAVWTVAFLVAIRMLAGTITEAVRRVRRRRQVTRLAIGAMPGEPGAPLDDALPRFFERKPGTMHPARRTRAVHLAGDTGQPFAGDGLHDALERMLQEADNG